MNHHLIPQRFPVHHGGVHILTVPPAPVDSWTLDEASGQTRAASTTSPGWDLADANTVAQAAGVIDTAALFDGADYLIGGDICQPNDAKAISWGWWQYLTVLPSVDNRDMYPFGKWTGADNVRDYTAYISKDASGEINMMQVRGENSDDSVFRIVGTNRGALAIETWYGFVAVYDGNRTGKEMVLYSGINGSDDFIRDQATVQPAAGDLAMKRHATPFTIGGFPSHAGVRLKGRVDAFAFWDVALTQQQARGFINEGVPVQPPFS